MADIRINALATTATTPASDDYLALDGAAQGTRKILATNIANNVTDVILGTSGPSVKSTLSARAPRQGLVFDGTNGATCSAKFCAGTAHTLHGWITPTTSDVYRAIFSNRTGGGSTNGVLISRADTGIIAVYQATATPANVPSTGTAPINKTTAVTVVFDGSSVKIYLNGVLDTSTNVSGYPTGLFDLELGVDGAGGVQKWIGGLSGSLLYNRALSASEVVALYEAGVPSGADYNSASNTAINTGFANSGLAYTTFSGASATGFTATSNGSGLHIAWMTPQAVALTPGQRFLVTLNLTLNSGTAPSVSFGATPTVNNLKSNVQLLTAGANSFVLTATAGGTSDLYFYNNATATNYSVSSVSVTRLGLLLAPDAAQAGGGLTWYDTSGNAANITLPASGVSWNVPSSAKVATGWAFGGDVGIGTTSPTAIGSSRVTQINSTTGNTSFLLFSTNSTLNGSLYANASETSLGSISSIPLLFKTADVEKARITSSGNYLIGTTTDSANGKLQLATHTTSAGGIGFGTGMSLFTSSTAGQLVLKDGSGTSPFLAFYDTSNNNRMAVGAIGTTSYVNSVAGPLQLWSSNTLALTLDSSQNATFAGNVTAGGQIKSTFASDYCFYAAPSSGANRNIAIFGVAGATNGFTIKWDNASATMRVNIQNLPTSATGLAAGDLYNSAGTLKIA